jgi:N-acetylmuramoyl-L-alanine amidase
LSSGGLKNDETRMTNDEPMTKFKIRNAEIRHSDFELRSSFVIRHSSFFFACFAFVAFCSAQAQHISPLGTKPDWSRLEAFQETITHDEFVKLLDSVYAPNGTAKEFIQVEADHAEIVTTATEPVRFRLRFAANTDAAKNPPRYWRPASALPPADQATKPLAGLRVALDPGHLGGKWAKVEERWFRVGNKPPIAEGDMTLRVAKLLAPKLRELGASVSFVRDSSVPTTGLRSEKLRAAALQDLQERKVELPADAQARGRAIENDAQRLFYRVSEIHGRARLLNDQIRPDITLCLHFNAEGWGDQDHPKLSEKNHLHLLVNGCYQADELAFDDVRFEMLLKLLSRCFGEELAASEAVADAMARATGLPPYLYATANAVRADGGNYVWARNLLANRLYNCPVVYIEPYVMNNQNVIDRIALGDYEGEREIGGAMRKGIFREYADAVADGLRTYFKQARGL